MLAIIVRAFVVLHGSRLRSRLADDAGEGVISTAIAVLVMAFLGVAMWVAFNEIFRGATSQIEGQINQIGG